MEQENQNSLTEENLNSADAEISAIGIVYNALKHLDNNARARVLAYVADKLGTRRISTLIKDETATAPTTPITISTEAPAVADDELDGVSLAGRKWISRNGIDPTKLMNVFSLGIEEIDLVSNNIPGEKKSQRMRNVFLLKGIASYLGTGVARITHEQVKEACLHYDAYDSRNFATYYKSMGSIVSGGKDTGYTLTAKGLAEGTTLVKSMIGE